MQNRIKAAALLIAAGAAFGAYAQDSTSINPAAGDAVSPYDTSEQINTYVVDLAPVQTSWGNTFGVAPIAKTSKVGTLFRNVLGKSYGISPDSIVTGFPFQTYAAWDGPGFGINGQFNEQGMPVMPSGQSIQLGFVIDEGGQNSAGLFYAGAMGGVINYQPSNPTRLYVSRINGATNGATPNVATGTFGVGSADANGNIYFRADNNFQDPGPAPLVNNNIFRIDLLGRSSGVVNQVSALGAADPAATDWLLMSSNVAHSTPSNIPESIAGRPVYFGGNFDAQLRRESIANTAGIADSTHLAAGVINQRGVANYSPVDFFGGTAGTGAVLGRINDPTFGAEVQTVLNIFGLDANGNPIATMALEMPQSIIDPATGFDTASYPDSPTTTTPHEFDHYHSQVPFDGGAQIAMSQDADGRLLVAAIVYARAGLLGNQNPVNYIAVARVDSPSDTDIEWTLAGYVQFTTTIGSPIWDGAPSGGGNTIGTLQGMDQLVGVGPSFSSPTMDAAGNVWFVAPTFISGDFGPRVSLVRGVYDEANFRYDLEIVLRSGDGSGAYDIMGQNSNTPYRVTFIDLQDSNSVDSSAMWANAATSGTWAGSSPSTTESPANLGGLVLNAEITYDVAAPMGDFDDAAGDESYQTLLLFAGAFEEEEPSDCRQDQPCPPNVDGAGLVDSGDFFTFIPAFLSGDANNPVADYDCSGVVDSGDFFLFIGHFIDPAQFPGC